MKDNHFQKNVSMFFRVQINPVFKNVIKSTLKPSFNTKNACVRHVISTCTVHIEKKRFLLLELQIGQKELEFSANFRKLNGTILS